MKERKPILKNWKTSLLGGGSLTAAVIYFANNPDDYKTALGMAVVGLLGLFSADAKKDK